MVRPVPIPPHLWHRLAALDARCDLAIVRQDANQPSPMGRSGRKCERGWALRIYPRGDSTGMCVGVYGAGPLRAVLEHAITSVEQYGWHRPAARQLRRGLGARQTDAQGVNSDALRFRLEAGLRHVVKLPG